MKKLVSILLLLIVLLSACQKDMPAFEDDSPYYLDLPSFAPKMVIPEDNPLTKERVAMGEKLFFDKRLSRDLTVSCATCHQPEKAFADNEEKAIGIDDKEGLRNVPTLFNIGYSPRLLLDGGAPNLEAQVLVPVQSHKELDMTLAKVVDRLESDPEYQQLSRSAFGTEITELSIMKALAAYQRTLVAFNSPFDDYYYRGNEDALSEEAKKGLQLFFSEKTNCAACHQPPLFTDYSFENIGLYESYADSGRGRIIFSEADLGKFKVPTLRNVALTPPYMHNGSMKNLEEVVAHFNAGGENHPNKSGLLEPLNLSETEQKALVSFLESLTEYSLQKHAE